MAERNASGEIRAAGGVILRRCGAKLQVLLVHRPAFDDWTLPKGKVKRLESEIEAALREVVEETGFDCAIGAMFGDMHYVDRKGRARVTRYWAMTVTGGAFKPSAEVDACQWFEIATAAATATRSGERDFLRLLSERLRPSDDGAAPDIDAPLVVHEQPL